MDEPLKDKWNFVYITIIFHGLGTLIAWNMFITAKDYFVQYKLGLTPKYAHNFLAYIGLASQIPNLCFNWFNVFVHVGGSFTARILFSLAMEILLFILTIILAMADTSNSAAMFFWVTMLTVFLLNGFNAIYQNSLFGIAGRLPPRYIGGVILGANICGTLVVLLSWMSRYFKDLHTSAIYYFLAGMFVLVICFDTYFAIPITKFFRYYQTKYEGVSKGQKLFAIDIHFPYGLVFKQGKEQFYNVFITFFVTLAMFPAVLSDVKPVHDGFLGEHFVIITCFLTFNVMAMIGSITASSCQIPSPRFVKVFTSVRLLFIPFFLFCNYQPPSGRSLKVIIKSDWIYWLASIYFGWSSGHGSTLAMMYVTGTVAPEHAQKTGMIAGAMLMTGLTAGILFTRVCPLLV